ncbi:MAG: hypothetical protein JSS78_01990 [Bacteroidetes bacterium]|nr:hypothetical protein [Bacteroidota bacterium]
MKKQFLLAVGSVLALASCQNEASNLGVNQAQIDSLVNARVDAIKIQMMAQNDSIINAEATRRADSIVAAMKGGAPVAKPAPAPSHTVVHHTPAAPKEDKGSTTTRPGADNGKAKHVTDRPGADNGANKSVSDRPGADKH